MNEKSGFTSLATISLAGGKFPLVNIAKGKTETAEANWFSPGRSITLSHEVKSNAPKIRSVMDKNKLITANSYTDHSKSGWTTNETWKRYLHKVRQEFVPVLPQTVLMDPVNRILLLCDSYKVHHSNEAHSIADSLNINLYSIPAGATDACQPMNCRIFGALKAEANAFMTKMIADHIFSFF